MSWSFVIPGQAPSWNKSYKITEQSGHRGDGSEFHYRTLSKTPQVIQYQDMAVPIIRSAKPSRWAPEGQVRVIWDIYLTRDIDCDNLMKAVHDAIERATGINDARFLPCIRTKTTGVAPRDARVEILMIDVPSSIEIVPSP